MSFNEFNLQPFLVEAIEELGFTEPTAVQKRLIPVIKSGKSVVGKSQTGSGKTHTFLLPIFDKIDPELDEVQSLITTPSRELAYQIYEAAKQLASHSEKPIRVVNYVGGTDKARQQSKLHHEQPQIVIGTPGRLLDLVKGGDLDIHTSRSFVVDEADMTLDMGFLSVVDQIASRLPNKLQMMVFSATIPQKLQPFLKKYMSNPVMEEIPVTSVISPTIDNWLISTKGQNKNDIIYNLLTMGEPYLALIFANTKSRVKEITKFLKQNGLKVAMIEGDLPPRERKRVMREVQNLDYQFVVATDLASRGIDIDGVSHVINDGIPEDLDFFIHRVGRTGRKGMAGIAITLYTPDEESKITEIESMGIKFQPKAIQNGEVVDSYDRNRRKQRSHGHEELDGALKAKINKTKKKVKPGYKKKIKKEINKDLLFKRRLEQRQKGRTERKRKKQDSNRYQ
ncbi:DEAD/DEAH box helicase [Secundilactobacillus malefermentans]|uniref:DEAD-box ATP-dependent RNA helicase CshB n=1 Tax=Secundilactobacillus malefermentans TaxID=176292 RepID=A0A4R5NIH0_9LACO|nr:DEAD/DEAH box helicase [Secundilactobacillus malefermentans]KRM59209.1 superfamily II DNA RNA helicase [Secundilactobacillus malefermentans DSM 5705 = KCTC 3548]QEA32212.1 DEAD/DEAH box helicase [Secundilactobacillus malefermentans]TDG74337.1 hypothetical protein C5L31_000904 [Secundilactobacillus malefermentans]